ncbi:hypothetical protein [Brevibacterium aurantiacum]|uniref:hypothetical protein n=1 Tax=Brevibacterium aurantiacum TaxID=273384 RepID=UPI000FCAE7CD|nr:hypothetical protein [Brevibacterium aurantiacum]
MQEQNTRILELIDAANQSITDETESHQVLMQGDILAMFDEVDMLITDVSSVGLDFLYLHPTKPLVLTDRRNNIDKLTGEAPLVEQPRLSTVARSRTRSTCCIQRSPRTQTPKLGLFCVPTISARAKKVLQPGCSLKRSPT